MLESQIMLVSCSIYILPGLHFIPEKYIFLGKKKFIANIYIFLPIFLLTAFPRREAC